MATFQLAQVKSGGVDSIRFPLLEDPMIHLFNTNKLVEKMAAGTVLTYARATTATYVDRYGAVQSVAIDTPREEKEGFLIEGASTNLALYSEDFSDVTWVKAGALTAVLSGEYVGGSSSSLEYWDLDNISSGGDQLRQSIGYIANQVVTYSVIAKAGTNTTIRLRINNADTIEARNTTVEFDLDSGVVVSSSGVGFVNASIEELATGEWLCQYTHETSANPTSFDVRIQNDLTGGTTLVAYAQLEALSFATSYIPTLASPVTRAADDVSCDVYNNLPTTTRSVFFTVEKKGLSSANRTIMAYRSTFGSNNASIYFQSNQEYISVYDGSVNVVATSTLIDGTHNITLIYKDDGTLDSYVDGVLDKSGLVVSASAFDSIEDLKFGATGAAFANPLNSILKDLRIYDFALNQDEVKLLSNRGDT